jgi:hypothetical protein
VGWCRCLQRDDGKDNGGARRAAERGCGHLGWEQVVGDESLAGGESNARLCGRLLVVSRLQVGLRWLAEHESTDA